MTAPALCSMTPSADRERSTRSGEWTTICAMAPSIWRASSARRLLGLHNHRASRFSSLPLEAEPLEFRLQPALLSGDFAGCNRARVTFPHHYGQTAQAEA